MPQGRACGWAWNVPNRIVESAALTSPTRTAILHIDSNPMTTLLARARSILVAACILALPVAAQFAEDPDPAKALAKGIRIAESAIEDLPNWHMVSGTRAIVTYGWDVRSSKARTEKNRKEAARKHERIAADASVIMDQIDAVLKPRSGAKAVVLVTQMYPNEEELMARIGKDAWGRPTIRTAPSSSGRASSTAQAPVPSELGT